MKEQNIVMILPPSKDLKNHGFRNNTPDEEIEQIKNGYMSEERLALLSCEPCPICGERNHQSFYEKRNRKWNAGISKHLNIEDMSTTMCGLVKSEKPVKKLFSKERYYVSEYLCLTCGSTYRSKPYRKNKYVRVKQ